jgi:[ribosomal protein S18]-alanine N-acetyltransferase
MTITVSVRDMIPEDVPVIADIERASYSVPWSELTFRGLLRRQDAELIVAAAGETIVGYSVLWCVMDQAELGNVAVSAAWRRRGVGELLVGEMIRRAAARGIREVFLEVRPSNTVARRLYERFGFAHVGRRRNYYQKPVEDALVLKRPIEPALPRQLEG